MLNACIRVVSYLTVRVAKLHRYETPASTGIDRGRDRLGKESM